MGVRQNHGLKFISLLKKVGDSGFASLIVALRAALSLQFLGLFSEPVDMPNKAVEVNSLPLSRWCIHIFCGRRCLISALTRENSLFHHGRRRVSFMSVVIRLHLRSCSLAASMSSYSYDTRHCPHWSGASRGLARYRPPHDLRISSNCLSFPSGIGVLWDFILREDRPLAVVGFDCVPALHGLED